jgi:hypothetical protein
MNEIAGGKRTSPAAFRARDQGRVDKVWGAVGTARGACAMNRPGDDRRSQEQLTVKLVGEDCSSEGVGAIVKLRVKTTQAHRAAPTCKLDVNSTARLVRYGVRARLVDV